MGDAELRDDGQFAQLHPGSDDRLWEGFRFSLSVDSQQRAGTRLAGYASKKVIGPAAERAGIQGKTIGWHTFRYSLGTNLRSLGVEIKVAQELLWHSNARITLV